MKPREFIRQSELLTGTPVKGESEIDWDSLSAILREDTTPLDCSHLNELLLLVHKDRVEIPFFLFFFGSGCTVGGIPLCVARFQRTALLLYGNFVFAYRKLSRIKSAHEFATETMEVSRIPADEFVCFEDRQRKLLEVDLIARDLTPFVGYLSVRDLFADLGSCELLLAAAAEVGESSTWADYTALVEEMANVGQQGPLREIIANYQGHYGAVQVSDFKMYLERSFQSLNESKGTVRDVRMRATRNQNIYLTWDHMDVYFATSMRKAWEYQDLYDFIDSLMSTGSLVELDLRYFDPTQAYTDNRINKGLVEALMLKRARCTVYSVQDTDTLGKDSELASTLAQGKPVIAYIPNLDVEKRAAQLALEAPSMILERLRFVLYADEQLAQRLNPTEYALVDRVQDQLAAFCGDRIWLSVKDQAAEDSFRAQLGGDLLSFCTLVASSEKAVYDKRAFTLKEAHPLALQVNLATGVANGVLVVRNISDCATLLRRILVSDMEFDLEEKDGMWLLRERISQCIYRVVTNDRKLNNCFWNFYLR